MSFPPSFLEELRNRLTLSEIVGRRMRLIRAGREFKSPCPFHNEKTPSFTVNDHKGFFHCFGCGAHGDVVGFVMRYDHLSFPEAVEQLAGLAGLQVPRTSPEERQRFERERGLHDLVECAARWFEEQLRLPGGQGAMAYLQRRGLDEEAMGAFRLGYAPADGAALRIFLRQEGFEEAAMIEAGLLRRPNDGRPAYSFFRNRVMFPVADRRGRVVAFGARLMEGDGPKYINSSETPLFHKGALLYGQSRALQAALDGAPVLVVEGYMDVIALVRAGWPGAVAPLGTALTEGQIEALWRLLPESDKRPMLCFDGDNAGRRAALRALDRALPLLRPGHSLAFCFLPNGEDPDSLIRARGPAAMQAVLARSVSFADMLWEAETIGRVFDTPEARAGLEAALMARIERIAERSVQFQYRDDMRQRLRRFFWTQSRGPARGTNQRGPGRPGMAPASPKPPTPPRGSDQAWHRMLLATLVNHPALVEEFGELLALEEIPDPGLSTLRDELVRVSAAFHDLLAQRSALHEHLNAAGHGPTVLALCSRSYQEMHPFTRPDADPEDARATLSRWLTARNRQRAAADMSALMEATRSNLTPESYRRQTSLSRTLSEDAEDELGPEM